MSDAWIGLNPLPNGPGAVFNGLALLSLLLLLSQHIVLMLRAVGARSRLRKLPAVKSKRQLVEALERLASEIPILKGPCQHLHRSAEVINKRLVLGTTPASVLQLDLLRKPKGALLMPPTLLDHAPWLLALWGLAGAAVSAAGASEDILAAATSPLAWGLITATIAGLFGAASTGAARGAIGDLIVWLEEATAAGRAAKGDPAAGGEDLMPDEDPRHEELITAIEQLTRGQQALADALKQPAALDASSLEGAFRGALQAELAPALSQLSVPQAQPTPSAEAVPVQLDPSAISAAVIAGLDGSIGESLRRATDTLERVSLSQRSALGDWRDSVSGLTDLVQQLDQAGRSLAKQSQTISQASAPSLQAAETSLKASEELARIVPALENARSSWEEGQSGVTQALEALNQGTSAYREAGELLRTTVEDLRGAQRETSREMMTAATTAAQEMHEAARASALELQRATVNSSAAMQNSATQTSASLQKATAQASESLQKAVAASSEALQEATAESTASLQTAVAESSAALQTATADGSAALQKATAQSSAALQQATSESSAALKGQLDEALVGAMKEAGGQLRRFAERQEQGLDSWERATSGFTRTVDRLQGIAGELRGFSEGLASATEPSLEAGRALQRAAASLEQTVPSIERAAQAQSSSERSMQAAAQALQSGTDGYLDAAKVVKDLVAELQATHAQAIERISTGIDEAMSDSLRQAGDRIEQASAAQSQQLAAWQASLVAFTPAVDRLTGSAQALDTVVGRFQSAAEPAAAAAQAFQHAAGAMGELVPKMDQTTQSYEGMNRALVRAARQLSESSRAYAEAGSEVAELVNGLQATLDKQLEGNQHFIETVGQATGFIQALGPASQSVKTAAQELEQASTHTAQVVGALKETVIVQGKAVTHMRDSSTGIVNAMAQQQAQWQTLMGDMDKLQRTLSVGVDTIGKRLPTAIDGTMVHFDAALGEGVERMGSSIERLREAMDDLQERLETLMAKGR
ncbi:MAG: hypothetical protein VX899_25290 [Myxococcota bacterium]|nr:hypothetical protein [Myxococcota bacterium]